MKEFHYVYHLIDPVTGQFYLGSRTCKGITPQEDTKYMGSMYTWKPEDKNRLKKTILREFDSREDANIHEGELQKLFINDPLNENYHIQTVGFHCVGKKFTQEEIDANRKRQTEKSGVKCFLYELYSDTVHKFNARRDCSRFLTENNAINSRPRANKTFIDGEYLYTTEYITQEEKKELLKNSKQVELKVVQLDKHLNLINTYDSLRDAMRTYGATIASVVNPNLIHKSAYGYHWMYYIDYLFMTKGELIRHFHTKFKVLEFTTDEINFIRNPNPKMTVRELCDKFKCSHGTIDNIRGKKGKYSFV